MRRTFKKAKKSTLSAGSAWFEGVGVGVWVILCLRCCHCARIGRALKLLKTHRSKTAKTSPIDFRVRFRQVLRFCHFTHFINTFLGACCTSYIKQCLFHLKFHSIFGKRSRWRQFLGGFFLLPNLLDLGGLQTRGSTCSHGATSIPHIIGDSTGQHKSTLWLTTMAPTQTHSLTPNISARTHDHDEQPGEDSPKNKNNNNNNKTRVLFCSTTRPASSSAREWLISGAALDAE